MRTFLAIVRKDLRVEGRSRDLLPAMAILALLLLTVTSAAGLPSTGAPTVLWVAVVFAASTGLARSFHQETDQDQLSGLLMAPVNPALIYAGKALANFMMVLGVEAVTLLALQVFFNVDLAGRWLPLAGVMVLGSAGIVALGTLLGAMLASSRLREALLPLLLLPLAAPALMAAVGATAKVLAGQAAPAAGEVRLLAAFTLLFIAVPVVLFEFVMQE